MREVKAVFLDVGYTIVDETRLWNLWADWLEVDRSVFLQELSAVVRRGVHHHQVFERFRPGFEVEAARIERAAAGWPPDLAAAEDVYSDVAPCLERLRQHGYWVGISGNQPAQVEDVLRARLNADLVASSESWRVAKPSLSFFAKVAEIAGVPAQEIAYVGDRLDGDILPAVACGMVGVFLRRGPWGVAHAEWPQAEKAHIRIDGLDELPAALADLETGGAEPDERS